MEQNSFKNRAKLAWLILTKQYNWSLRYSCWWIWDTDSSTMVTFDQKSRNMREVSVLEMNKKDKNINTAMGAEFSKSEWE
jgi:hypothetical protein